MISVTVCTGFSYGLLIFCFLLFQNGLKGTLPDVPSTTKLQNLSVGMMSYCFNKIE